MRGLALVSFLLPCFVWAAQDNELPGKKLVNPPIIDGKIEDAEWRDAARGEGFFDEENGEPTDGGRFWIAYDADAVYFAAQVDMSNPGALRADEFRDNVSLGNDDNVAIGLDLFGSLARVNQFGVNARGATSIQIAGGRAAKREWLGEFQAMGRPTPTGFEVEARIPWAIMSLPAAGPRTVRFNVIRSNPSTGRVGIWRYTRTNPENNGKWLNVDIPRTSSRRPLKLLPYVYGGADSDKGIFNSGLDFKGSLSDRIEAVGSISPDFRNIENQILSLDFSYFERLAGESRPFFLEGGDLFTTSRDAPLFASQRIRNFDVGLKSFGQIDDRTDVALLDTVDFGERNNFAGRIQHRPDSTSSLMFAGTSLSQGVGPRNDAWFGSYFKSLGAYGLFGQWSESKDTDLGVGRRINTGVTYGKGKWESLLEYLEITPGYLPRLGFAPERGLRGLNASVGYLQLVPKGGLMEYGFNAGGNDYRSTQGGPYRRNAYLSTTTTWRNGLDFDTYGHYTEFRGFKDRVFGASLELPRGNNYRRWEVGANLGNVAGQPYKSIQAAFSVRPLRTLQIHLQAEALDHFERETQVILGANYDLTKSDSFSGRAVTTAGHTNAYVAFRRAGNAGAEYFVILGDPNARSFRTSLVIKAVFPFELKF